MLDRRSPTFDTVQLTSPTYSEALCDVGLLEITKLETFKILFKKLHFEGEQNLKVFLNLIIKTGFLDELLINLSYLRGLEDKKEITHDEIIKIIKIRRDYYLRPKTLNTAKLILVQLLASKIFEPCELYNCVVIHQQRNYFNQKWFKTLNDRCQTLIDSLVQQKELTGEELKKISEIAVFGATYSTMKTRLDTGLKYYKEKKKSKPKKIYLLTGQRQIYLSELKQLGIISDQNFKSLQEQNISNIGELMRFIGENPESAYSKWFDKSQLVEVLNKIKKASKDCKFTKEKFAETDNLKELLEQAKLIQEKDLFLLAFSEVASELKDKELKNKMELVYSDQTNGVGVMQEKTILPRSNTYDTLMQLLEKLKQNKEEFAKILFVSNDGNILQQFSDALSVSDGNGQICLEKFNFGTIKNISATCFALEPYIAKILEQQSIQPCLAREHAEGLNGIFDTEEAYRHGETIRKKVPLPTTERLVQTSKGTGMSL